MEPLLIAPSAPAIGKSCEDEPMQIIRPTLMSSTASSTFLVVATAILPGVACGETSDGEECGEEGALSAVSDEILLVESDGIARMDLP